MNVRWYAYSLVRYVPNPTIGEFINVGIIAGNDAAGDWSVRWLKNLDRAARLARTHGSDTVEFLKYYMGQVQGFVEPTGRPKEAEYFGGPEETISETWLVEMHELTNNLIRFTQPLPVAGTCAKEALDFICEDLLFEPKSRVRSQSRRRLIASVEGSFQRAMSDALGEHHVTLGRDVTVRSNGFTDRSALAVFDDEHLQLTSMWSFDVSAAQHTRVLERVRSFLWFVEHTHGKPLTLVDRHQQQLGDAQPACHIAAIVQPPDTHEGRAAYDEAIDSIDATTDVERFHPDTIDTLAHQVAHLFT